MSEAPAARDAVVRPYRPDDRAALYAVCLATGRDGEDASALFRDPDLLGHRYVGPYLDLEPELSFTLEDAVGPCGYVLGTDDSQRFYRRFVDQWLPALRATLAPAPAHGTPTPTHGADPAAIHGADPAATRATAGDADERLLAELHAPTITLPRDLATYPAHLHIDLLPRAQGKGHGRRMVRTLLDALIARGANGAHLGVSPRNRRGQAFYRALGFTPIAAETDDPGTLLMGRRLP